MNPKRQKVGEEQMVDNSRVVLENKKEYYVIDRIELENKAFIYLTNPDNPKDFCCRKEIEENGKTFLVGLDNKEEADMALKLFFEKHQDN